jgi:cytochrome P450
MLDHFERPLTSLFQKRLNEYGHIYGTYYGARPRLVVSDPRVLKKIMIQDFIHFTDRKDGGFDHPIEQKMFGNLEGLEWRNGRSASSVAFSSGKLKAMTPLITESTEKLIENIPKILDKTVDGQIQVNSLYRSFSLNNIGKTMFGVDLDIYDWENANETIKTALGYFESSSFRSILSTILPKWIKTSLEFTVFNKKSLNALIQIIKSIIKKRTTDKSFRTYPDFVSLMLNRRINPGSSIQSDKKDNEDFKEEEAVFTDDEIVANCILFLVAGSHSSTLLLTILTFVLTKHPDVQERLYQEIRGVVSNNKERQLSYESFNEMPFLDAVVNELLRVYPIAIFTERRVSKEYDLVIPNSGKVLTLPVGTLILIPIFAIHRNEENFFEADKFAPERFMGDNKRQIDPMTYLPFGHGPRNCIGIRTALLNTKMAIASVLLVYRLEHGDKTPEFLDISETRDELLQIPDIFIKFVRRNSAI